MTLIRSLWVMLLLLLVGGAIVLSMWGIPAPTSKVERVIPHDQFKRS